MNQKLIIGLLALIGSMISSAALAQNYPDRPVKIVVPYSAGGTADFSKTNCSKANRTNKAIILCGK